MAKAGETNVPPDRRIHIDETIILAAARMLQLRKCPQSVLLDFLWLLFSQAKQTSNIDELVSIVTEDISLELMRADIHLG
jgi:hypothetical protein